MSHVRQYEFSLKGLTPLLMHADNISFADRLQAWRQDPANKSMSRAGDDRTPAWTWVGSVYHDDQHVSLPTDNLAVAVRQAGAKVTMKGKKTFKEEAVSGIFFEQDQLKLTVNGAAIPYADIVKLLDESEYPKHIKLAEKYGFELFMKRAAVGTSKHIRVRPKFDNWSCEGTISVDSPALKPEVLEQIFLYAGKVGVGSWRPGGKTPGRFGMFEATIKAAK